MPEAVRPGPARMRPPARPSAPRAARLPVSASVAAALSAATATLLAGCSPFFYPAAQVEVTNRSADPVEALVSASPDSELFTEVAPGATEGLDWPTCHDGWVVVRYARGELLREELRICPDDTVEVTLSRQVVVRCGKFSSRERADC